MSTTEAQKRASKKYYEKNKLSVAKKQYEYNKMNVKKITLNKETYMQLKECAESLEVSIPEIIKRLINNFVSCMRGIEKN